MKLDDLDRLAAEKIMGWEMRYQVWYNFSPNKPIDVRHDYLMSHQWKPTRNIVQAWECLDKVRDNEQSRKLWQNHGNSDWSCEIGGHWSYGGTIQKAIIRACLYTKGIELD